MPRTVRRRLPKPPPTRRRCDRSAMKVKLQIAHQVPGRVRMKIPSAKGDPALLEEIQKTFSAIPGIEEVAVNPETGSMVLKYDVDRHDDFHAGFTCRFNEHHGGDLQAHRRPPTNEIDALA